MKRLLHSLGVMICLLLFRVVIAQETVTGNVTDSSRNAVVVMDFESEAKG